MAGHAHLITDARVNRTADRKRRQSTYIAMMALRVGCVIGMIFTPFPWALLLLAGAALLPIIGVTIANAVDRRGERGRARPADTDPAGAMLDDGSVVPGTVAGEDEQPGSEPQP